MTSTKLPLSLGVATITSPRSVVAGSYQCVQYQFTVHRPIDDTGFIKIVFRYASDFGTPQFDQPSDPNFCTVSTDGECQIHPRWDAKGHLRPWGKALFLKIMGGYLDVGDRVWVCFGDPDKGSPGWKMQTFCEKSFEFKTLVDPFASYRFKELDRSPTLNIIPGPPVRRILLAPSQALVGKGFWYHVKQEDVWGNPSGKLKRMRHTGFSRVGIHRIRRQGAISNPIQISQSLPALTGFWADFHGQSEETIGTNSIEDYFRFARDVARLDIAGHQGNDFQITDEFWGQIKRVAEQYTHPGKFITFPSFEWSGNTPLGGDRNVYFLTPRGEITRSSNELLPNEESVYPISPTAHHLFQHLRTQHAAKPFCFAHVGGRYADLATHDPDLEWAVEVHSAWGTFEWFLREAFDRGYRVGICANSDGHKGRPGASYPGASRFGAYGGLTCVLAESLTRDHVYQALKARHFYATTGHRCLLGVHVHDGKKQVAMMGDVLSGGKVGHLFLQVRVAGTGPIERVDILNGGNIMKTVRPYGREDLGSRIKVLWRGAEVRGRARKVDWSGSLVLRGNRIRGIEPVQFLNPACPVEQIGDRRVVWKSITTGNASGFILDLEKPEQGRLYLETLQGRVTYDLRKIGIRPRIRQFGGIEKRIEICRLPDPSSTREMEVTVPLKSLKPGDNPVYARVTQIDGHTAWSSPVYVVRAAADVVR